MRVGVVQRTCLTFALLTVVGCSNTLVYSESTGFNLGVEVDAAERTPIGANFGLRRQVVAAIPSRRADQDGNPDGEAVSMLSRFDVTDRAATTTVGRRTTVTSAFASGQAAIEIAEGENAEATFAAIAGRPAAAQSRRALGASDSAAGVTSGGPETSKEAAKIFDAKTGYGDAEIKIVKAGSCLKTKASGDEIVGNATLAAIHLLEATLQREGKQTDSSGKLSIEEYETSGLSARLDNAESICGTGRRNFFEIVNYPGDKGQQIVDLLAVQKKINSDLIGKPLGSKRVRGALAELRQSEAQSGFQESIPFFANSDQITPAFAKHLGI